MKGFLSCLLVSVSITSEMNEDTKLLLTPEMIHAEFIEAHVDASSNGKQE